MSRFGVFANSNFDKGCFLLEYRGEIISEREAATRLKTYEKNEIGCFIYHGIKDVYGKSVCIDATNQVDSLGKMVNDSTINFANSIMKRIVISSCVHLCLFALKSIDIGTEIRYDYGDHDELMHWRKQKSLWHPYTLAQLTPENNKILEVSKFNESLPHSTPKKSSCNPYTQPTSENEEMFRVSKFNKSFNSSTPKVDFEVSSSSKCLADIVDLDFYDSDSSIEYLPSLNILLANATQEKDNFNHKSDLETELLPSVLNCSGYKTHAPIDSFGTTLDSSEESVEFNNDSLTERGFLNKNIETICFQKTFKNKKDSLIEMKSKNEFLEKKYKKPSRPCMFCQKTQTRLKRHILKKHKNEPLVIPILSMNKKEQDRELDVLRKKGIRNYNSVILKTENNEFMRERRNFNCTQDMPVMCSECKGFFSKKFKARHQLSCPASNINVMVPIVSLTSIIKVDEYPDDFKELISTLILDEVGDCVKTDEIILMVGLRSFYSLKIHRRS
ncbi:uncharacterized protein LOC124816730 isoform X1 [Hydra vulgaris]|uniref:uncharacterized protein LOC124816730 isoform X1 n=2 Tax=Hydra vulgaris TaxID=6087 RepID=UPI001F5F3C89|nr:uncharacterized protein LOC124816730 isoform X3 [Hydra vulgaris]